MRTAIVMITMLIAISGCEVLEEEFWVGPDPCAHIPQENRHYHQGCY